MNLAVTKYGAFYLSSSVSFESRLVNGRKIVSAVLHDAFFVRRAKAVSKYHLVYLSRKSLAFVVVLPSSFDVFDVSCPKVLYNRLLDFVVVNKLFRSVKRLPERIIVVDGEGVI